MINEFDFKKNYNVYDLVQIMKMLRSENGCPWDKLQSHSSIRNNFIEEVYEVCDAIDSCDNESLKEELGDVLLQVVFHAQMECELDNFDFDDVADGICKKLILRHPHIFGDAIADSPEKVLDNWDKIKMVEKGQNSYSDSLKSVPRSFPSLIRAAKVQKRAAKAGFDWRDKQGPLDKIDEELNELKQAIDSQKAEDISDELGDLLFSIVNLSRFLDLDAEQVLQNASEKFINRFEKVEQLAKEKEINLDSSNLEALDKLWDEVKQKRS